MEKKIKAKGIEVQLEDSLQKLLRIKAQKFIRRNRLSPHFLDPYGDDVYEILEIALKEFGKVGFEKVLTLLVVHQNVRIIRELQKADLSIKLQLLQDRGEVDDFREDE